jgi:putative transposase
MDRVEERFKEFSDKKFPSVVVNQTIRAVKSQKNNQDAKRFQKMGCCFNNQNLRVEKVGDLYTISFPTLEKRIGVPVVTRPFQQTWLDKIIDGTVKQGAGQLYKKKQKWYIAIPITWNVETQASEKTMRVDLGLRYLAI